MISAVRLGEWEIIRRGLRLVRWDTDNETDSTYCLCIHKCRPYYESPPIVIVHQEAGKLNVVFLHKLFSSLQQDMTLLQCLLP